MPEFIYFYYLFLKIDNIKLVYLLFLLNQFIFQISYIVWMPKDMKNKFLFTQKIVL